MPFCMFWLMLHQLVWINDSQGLLMKNYIKKLLCVGLVFALAPSLAFAYLDPGSGSLLLSSVVALCASAVFFVKNLFYRIISFGSFNPLANGGGGGKPRHSLVFYSEGAQYYGTFKPILDALDSLNHPYTYYTSSLKDPALKRAQNEAKNEKNAPDSAESKESKTEFKPFHAPIRAGRGEFIYIGEGNRAYSFLNRLCADVFVLTTPGLDVLHIKRNAGVKHYCHIVHSLSPMTYRVFGVDYFDSVLVANAVQRDYVRDIEAAHNVKQKYIAITGSPYLDELARQSEAYASSTDSAKTILISPSWGKETLLSKYGLELLLPLAKSSFHIIIRPHPQSFISPSERENIEQLQAALKDYKNVEWDRDTPNVKAFARADMMISDFSSVIFDFVCLQGKPVLTIDNDMDLSGYDMADISRESIWTFGALDSIGGRIKSSDFSRIKELCERAMALGHLACNEGNSSLDIGHSACTAPLAESALNSSLGNHSHDCGDLEAVTTHKVAPAPKSPQSPQSLAAKQGEAAVSLVNTRIVCGEIQESQAISESTHKDSKGVSESNLSESTPSVIASERKQAKQSTQASRDAHSDAATEREQSDNSSANIRADSESLENDLMSKQSALISQSFRRTSGITSAVQDPAARSAVAGHSGSANSSANIESIRALLWQHPHNAGRMSALELLKIERELIEAELKPKAALVARLRELDSMIYGAQERDLKESKQEKDCKQDLAQDDRQDSACAGETHNAPSSKEGEQTGQDFTQPKGAGYA